MKKLIGPLLLIILAATSFYFGSEYGKGTVEQKYKQAFVAQRGIYHDLEREASIDNLKMLKMKIEFLSREWKELDWEDPRAFEANWLRLTDRLYLEFNEGEGQTR